MIRKVSWRQAGLLIGAAALTSLMLNSQPFRPVINTSISEPLGLYLLHHFGARIPPLNQHELVLFHYRSPRWAQGRYEASGSQFLKRVGALPGTWLFTKGLHQYACAKDRLTQQCRLLGTMLVKDPDGRAMHWPHWKGYQIPAGDYYMEADRVPISYDSRYYGLVSTTQLIGNLIPVVTWNN